MQQSHSLDSRFESFLQHLPRDVSRQARSLGAFCRARKVLSPVHLLRTAMLYCIADLSLRSCAGVFSRVCGKISDEALKKRFCAMRKWLSALLKDTLQPLELPQVGALRFIAVDGSYIQAPGARQAGHRLHMAMDMMSLELLQVTITDEKQAEHFGQYTFQEGDVVIADRIYGRAKPVIALREQGVQVVVRYNPQALRAYHTDAHGNTNKIQWLERLKWLTDNGFSEACFPVTVRDGEKRHFTKGYVHVMALPTEKAAQSVRRTKKSSKKRGNTVRASTLEYARWMWVFTTVEPEILDTLSMGALYRRRWQIELLIKRCKSLLSIDQLRARINSPLAQVYLLGKMLYCAVMQRSVSDAVKHFALHRDRSLTPWRLWHIQALDFKAALINSFASEQRWAGDVIEALKERKRRRSLQSLPDTVYELIEKCRELGVSNV